MEEEKNAERREQSRDPVLNSAFQGLSLRNEELARQGSSSTEESSEEGEGGELPDNLLQSFSTGGTDDLELLQKEYDMLSSSSLAETSEEFSAEGLDGEILNGVYFDKLELELSAIENAMSDFEGRLDTLRAQAQDLLLTLQKERSASRGESCDEKMADSAPLTTPLVEQGHGDTA
ncbi:uncharacterized protein LOC129596024 [Paramacrobiotus metropolitanus]|uniref:uncharacterized protein LOC129596024 n=1 Tax=Paramacrobiotus metropolitanus TaxID=2943436 RepID=UPI00244626CD|nr:uncharacterized protein LOC129596024 [Paramacrobiotus metropolitanus]